MAKCNFCGSTIEDGVNECPYCKANQIIYSDNSKKKSAYDEYMTQVKYNKGKNEQYIDKVKYTSDGTDIDYIKRMSDDIHFFKILTVINITLCIIAVLIYFITINARY